MKAYELKKGCLIDVGSYLGHEYKRIEDKKDLISYTLLRLEGGEVITVPSECNLYAKGNGKYAL